MAKTVLDDVVALARALRSHNHLAAPVQAAVLRWLATHRGAGERAPNWTEVARQLGLSRVAVMRAVRRLRERGFLEVQERPREPVAPPRVRMERSYSLHMPNEARQFQLPLA